MSDWLPERLPEDIDVERSLLATLCAPGAGPVASQCVKRITEALFVHPNHKALFLALAVLVEDHQEVNSLTLKNEMERQKTLARVGGYPGLSEILMGEDVERPQVLVDILLEKHRRRQIIHMAGYLVRAAVNEGEGSSLDLITNTMAELSQLSRGSRKEEVSSWSDILDMVEAGEAFRDGDGLCGGYWGIPALDEEAPKIGRAHV